MYPRCGNVAAILELDENLKKDYQLFEAAPTVSNNSTTYSPFHSLLAYPLIGGQGGAHKEAGAGILSLIVIIILTLT